MARNGLALDSDEERLAHIRESKARYKASPKGKAAEARYRMSERRREAAQRFRQSDKGKAWWVHDRNLRRHVFHNALRYGRLVRQPCEICGGSVELQGHHPFGYVGDMVLAVWWLCGTHHRGMHRAITA